MILLDISAKLSPGWMYRQWVPPKPGAQSHLYLHFGTEMLHRDSGKQNKNISRSITAKIFDQIKATKPQATGYKHFLKRNEAERKKIKNTKEKRKRND